MRIKTLLIFLLPAALFFACGTSEEKNKDVAKHPFLEQKDDDRDDDKGGRPEREEEKRYDEPGRYGLYQRMIRTAQGATAPTYNTNYLMKELGKAKQNRGVQNRNDLDFQFKGPINISGRARGLSLHPEDPENTWVVGTASGGIWKTENAGDTWTPLTDTMPNLGFNVVEFAPSNPEVLYAGTGEHFVTDIDGAGLFKSTNGGDSWFQIVDPAQISSLRNISRLIINPADENEVLVTGRNSVWGDALSSGIFKTTDGGTTWEEVYSEFNVRFDDIDFVPNNFNIQYASANNTGVYKSIDGGDTWAFISSDFGPVGRVEITTSPIDSNIVWALCEGNSSGNTTDLYFSEDGGQNWSLTATNPEIALLASQGWYDNIITASPIDKYVAYAGGVNLFKVTYLPEEVSNEVIKKVVGATSNFDLVDFGGSLTGGIDYGTGFSVDNSLNIEIRFGEFQKAHRYTVGGRTSGVPFEDYLYQDYVDIPFQVWDTENDRQLMVSFRDQQEDGDYDFIPFFNEEGLESREYFFVHNIEYATTPNTGLTELQGLFDVGFMYFFWPASITNNAPVQGTFSIIDDTSRVTELAVSLLSDVYFEYESGINSNWINEQGVTAGIHPDQHNIKIIQSDENPSEIKLIVTNDGGIYHTDFDENPGSTDNSFIYAGYGVPSTQFYGCDKSPTEERYIGGMQDNGTAITPKGEESGPTTAFNEVIGGDGFEALWNYRDPNLVIGSSQFRSLARSIDGGVSFSSVGFGFSDEGGFFSKLENSRAKPDRIFTVGSEGFWVSNDFGLTWELGEIDNFFFSGADQIEVSKSNPDIIWGGNNLSEFSGLFYSVDGGSTYTETPALQFPTAQGTVSGISSHPTLDSTGFALFSFQGMAKILRTDDLGQSWRDITGFESGVSTNGFPDVAITDLLVFPQDTSRYWAGTEIGIFESLDAGQTWNYMSDFFAANVHEFKIRGDDVVISTYGRGIWSVGVPGLEETVFFAPSLNNFTQFDDKTGLIDISVRSQFDSLKIWLDSTLISELGIVNEGDTSVEISSLADFEARTVDFYIEAFSNGEVLQSPEAAIKVADFENTFESFETDFEMLVYEEVFMPGGMFIDTFSGNNVLTSPSPYPANTNVQTAFRNGLVFRGNQEITYMDIALVEPGLVTTFPSPNLFDYVNIEWHSGDFNWRPVMDGYDAARFSEWELKAINQEEAVNEDFRSQRFEIAEAEGNPVEDQIMFLRFNLFSDEFAVSEGWIIDNFAIGASVTPTQQVQNATFKVFPNPASDVLQVEFETDPRGDLLIYDFSGKVVKTVQSGQVSKQMQITISGLENGTYILVNQTPSGAQATKFIKR